jgi:hypothetical protein
MEFYADDAIYVKLRQSITKIANSWGHKPEPDDSDEIANNQTI